MRNGLIVYKDGTKRWYKDDKIHREDGPAVKFADGTKEWFKDGKQHRADGPSAELPDGTKSWWYKDIFAGLGDKPDPTLWARLTSTEANGGPFLNGCVVDLKGVKWWYTDDVLHRENGPAVERADGNTMWYYNGELLGYGATGFWKMWDLLTEEQRGSSTLLRYLPR